MIQQSCIAVFRSHDYVVASVSLLPPSLIQAVAKNVLIHFHFPSILCIASIMCFETDILMSFIECFEIMLFSAYMVEQKNVSSSYTAEQFFYKNIACCLIEFKLLVKSIACEKVTFLFAMNVNKCQGASWVQDPVTLPF